MRNEATRPQPSAVEAGRLLRELHLTLATAESCTGGLVSDQVTDVAGSSDYFLGGVVSYAYSAKESILGVRHATLMTYGAVSPETAAEMAQGARRLLGADIAVSVTGIAGPSGGSPGKPVGLVCLHLSAAGAESGEQYVWDGDRVSNKARSAEAALQMVLAYLRSQAGSRSDG